MTWINHIADSLATWTSATWQSGNLALIHVANSGHVACVHVATCGNVAIATWLNVVTWPMPRGYLWLRGLGPRRQNLPHGFRPHGTGLVAKFCHVAYCHVAKYEINYYFF